MNDVTISIVSHNQDQILVELLNDLIKFLKPSTKLCIACDITLESELIKSDTISNWKKEKYSFNKRPSIFLIQSNQP